MEGLTRRNRQELKPPTNSQPRTEAGWQPHQQVWAWILQAQVTAAQADVLTTTSWGDPEPPWSTETGEIVMVCCFKLQSPVGRLTPRTRWPVSTGLVLWMWRGMPREGEAGLCEMSNVPHTQRSAATALQPRRRQRAQAEKTQVSSHSRCEDMVSCGGALWNLPLPQSSTLGPQEHVSPEDVSMGGSYFCPYKWV